ncbi:MAG TPA: aldo/keto reductase [Vicinamibacterales bacterium]|nr:aldo/keto reductase [Vicinamibacterales bacterium]
MWPPDRAPLIGMGCMRLSTEPDRDERRALAVLHAALDAGVTFLDTADAYCRNAGDVGHNERLIARALEMWAGDRSRILVATKGGLTRPQGAWIPDGRARHLVAACEASRLALGVDRIDLYQLHVPDPHTPLATSVRALDSLRRDGRIAAIGLCNVNVGQIEEARRITAIDTVQVELGPWDDGTLLNGVAECCARHRIPLIAARPLGGVKRCRRALKDPVLVELASRHGVSVFDVVLAWLRALSDVIVPIPGPTRVDTARALAGVSSISLGEEDLRLLDDRFPSGRILRSPPPARSARPMRSEGDVVLIMGLPAAGKSTLARSFIGQGYARVNRDDAGGTLRALVPALDRLLDSGTSRIVLDNTYVSRKARAPIVGWAAAHGLPVRCVWLSSSVEDAQVNAASRIVANYGRLPEPDEIRRLSTRDVNTFAPTVQFRYQRAFEPPHPSEGFSAIEIVPFKRTRDPRHSNRALIVWCDGVLLRSRTGRRFPASPDDVEVDERPGRTLRRYAAEGWQLAGLSWQPEIAGSGTTVAQVEAVFARMNDQLGVAVDVVYCPHGGGPPACWCRKPLPGLGVLLIERGRLDAPRCIYVGSGPYDQAFARRLGFQYREAAEFFV